LTACEGAAEIVGVSRVLVRPSSFAVLIALIVTLLVASDAFAGPPESTVELDEQGYVVVPEPTEEALRYYRSGNVLWLINRTWTLLVPALILLTGFSARLRDWASKRGGKRWRATLIFLLAYLGLTFVLDLPLSYYGGFVRPHAYGLSSQSASKWLTDELIGLALLTVFALVVVPGTLAFIRKSPERWWIWTSLVAIPLAFLLLMLAPVFISPLFNDFGPMKDTGLEAEILALADRAGIEGSRVFEVEKSVDTNTVNAYVTGFASTKRIVLWDTIIAKLSREQLLVVMGHEMGHYVLGHVRNSMIVLAIAIPVTLLGFHLLAGRLIRRFHARFGFTSLDDVAALPLFLVLIGVFGLIVAPGSNAWSRHQEHESDRFALEITHDNLGCAGAFARLQQSNMGNPRPGVLFVLWRASHPPLGERIDFCNTYRPWETGEPLVYGDRFASPR
jgi:Zn-dependent protease with chaperone function